MEEDPDGEEQTLSALVYHPMLPLFHEGLGLVRRHDPRRHGGRPLEALEPPALGLVSLEVGRLKTVGIHLQVKVFLELRPSAV